MAKSKQTEREIARGIDPNAPKGVSFYSVETDETRYAKSGAQIQAYINSSNMGINASRGQDFGWRLSPEWVKRIRNFKLDDDKMEALAAKLRLEEGQVPNDIQILHHIYGRQLRAYAQRIKDSQRPYEERYLQQISAAAEAQESFDPGSFDGDEVKPPSRGPGRPKKTEQ